MKSNIIPRPEHPNPQMMRKNWVNLNGKWQFEIDYSVSGVDRGLYKSDTLASEITVPFCPESKLSGVGITDFMPCVWYKKALSFTEQELTGKRIILHFGAADFETRIWINGKSAGAPHVGGYGSFEYDITDMLTASDNIITVCCRDDTRSPKQGSGKQSPKYYSYTCFYTRTTGIWQTVWYETVPKSYIKSTRVTPDAENCSVLVQAELCGRGDFTVEVFYDGKPVGYARKNNVGTVAQAEIMLTEKHLWELGDGKLYDLKLTFGEDEVSSYFGLRSVELENGKFLLNGRPVFQRLVLDQGFYHDGVCTAPSDEALIRDIKCSMDAGFNGARLHQKVFEPRFLYHADRLGYMVWGEYGSWGFDTSCAANLICYLPDWLDTVKRDYNHPSVIGWCPFNETEFCTEPDRYAVYCDMMRRVYEFTKAYDPTRPCIDTSGWYHVVTDIFDIHDYVQDPEAMKERYKEPGSGIDNHFIPPSRQPWDGKAPLFMSEYGGIGLNVQDNNKSERTDDWSYGQSCKSREEFYARYEGLTHALLDNPHFLGFCYTQLTDVEQEKNGLYTYEDRAPKFDMEIIARINKKRAAIEE